MPSNTDEPYCSACDMTWVVASAHGLMVPLCQIHSGYCMSATRDGRPIILPDGRWRAAHRIYSTIHQHPMWRRRPNVVREGVEPLDSVCSTRSATGRSEEHTSELQSLMRNSY